MKVVVLTTSYPRGPDDVAGAFVREAVEQLPARGRGDPGRLARFVPPLRTRVRPRGSSETSGDVRGRAPRARVPRVVLGRSATSDARCGSRPRALVAVGAARDHDAARRSCCSSGARTSSLPGSCAVGGPEARRSGADRVVPVRGARHRSTRPRRERGARRPEWRRDSRRGRASPSTRRTPYSSGRLSEEKGILDSSEATEGLPRVIVGDGPLRDRVPDAVVSSRHASSGRYYERAAVVVCPSRNEGYGVAAREAMAHGRPGDRNRCRGPPRCRRSRRDWAPRSLGGTRRRCGLRSRRCSRTPSSGDDSARLHGRPPATVSRGRSRRSERLPRTGTPFRRGRRPAPPDLASILGRCCSEEFASGS